MLTFSPLGKQLTAIFIFILFLHFSYLALDTIFHSALFFEEMINLGRILSNVGK